MNNYVGGFSFNQRYKKTKRALLTICIIALVFFGIVFVIGIIANSDSAEKQNISAAIRENTQLKQQVAELTQQVEGLNAEIQRLNGEIEAMPPTEEEPYTPDGEQNVAQEPHAMENDATTPRDELRE